MSDHNAARSGRPRPALAMHKHTAWLSACSAVVRIADAAEALDNRAPRAALWRQVPRDRNARTSHTRILVLLCLCAPQGRLPSATSTGASITCNQAAVARDGQPCGTAQTSRTLRHPGLVRTVPGWSDVGPLAVGLPDER